MRHELSERDITAIEDALNGPGHPVAEVKIEGGKIVVVQISRKVLKKDA